MLPTLITDDDAVTRTLLEEALKKNHIPCLTATDAEDALTCIQHHSIGVLVTDLVMPGKNGIELFQAAKQQRHMLRGILFSSFLDYGKIDDIIMAGFDDCLPKPVDHDAFVDSVLQSYAILERWHARFATIRGLVQREGK